MMGKYVLTYFHNFFPKVGVKVSILAHCPLFRRSFCAVLVGLGAEGHVRHLQIFLAGIVEAVAVHQGMHGVRRMRAWRYSMYRRLPSGAFAASYLIVFFNAAAFFTNFAPLASMSSNVFGLACRRTLRTVAFLSPSRASKSCT